MPQNEQDPAETPSSDAVYTPQKRNSCPGVRIVRRHIYDSETGVTCYQSRQKTSHSAARCKQMRKDNPCPIHLCYKCRLNRYGEKADEVSGETWSCPRCRGICNCSLCMKKRPTGILLHVGKGTDFSSVHELLDQNGATLLDAARGINSGCPACLPPGN